jgi:hypothetical protein
MMSIDDYSFRVVQEEGMDLIFWLGALVLLLTLAITIEIVRGMPHDFAFFLTGLKQMFKT